MRAGGRKPRRFVGVAAVVALVAAAASPSEAARPRFEWMPGAAAAGTPRNFDRVGVLEFGRSTARNILVLSPGTSASAAYFAPLAETVTRKAKRWQVWAVERRENLLEDQSMLNRIKRGAATPGQLFDYYLGWLTNPAVKTHVRLVPDSAVPFARAWGMRVAVGDLRRVVRAARRRGGRVVLGGHSLGGSITTAYATWDFGGRPGARGLSGLVYIDGGSGPVPVGAEEARRQLSALRCGSPWLPFGGISAPFAGLFNVVGSTLARIEPHAPARLQGWPLLPANLHAPVRVTNEAGYGYALDTQTSPPNLIAGQAHLGHLAAAGDPRGWDDAAELTPIQRYARMFSGFGLRDRDGTAWYHPLRLTIDSRAIADGNHNAAQRVLHLRATRGHDLGRLRIYAFGAALGGRRVLDAARILARQSGIPRRNLTLVDRAATYAHNDPNSAFPRNAFVAHLVMFLARVGRG